VNRKFLWMLALLLTTWASSLISIPYGSINFTFEPLAMFIGGALLGSGCSAIAFALYAISRIFIELPPENGAFLTLAFIPGAYLSGITIPAKQKIPIQISVLLFIILLILLALPAFLMTELSKYLLFLIIGLLITATFLLISKFSYIKELALPMCLGLLGMHFTAILIRLTYNKITPLAEVISERLMLLGGEALLLLIAARIAYDVLRARDFRRLIDNKSAYEEVKL